jgi:hypothetical protein
MANASLILGRKSKYMGRVFDVGSHRVFPMDDSNQADRVNAYLTWRQVAALEAIAAWLEVFVMFLLVGSICYSGGYLLGEVIKFIRREKA